MRPDDFFPVVSWAIVIMIVAAALDSLFSYVPARKVPPPLTTQEADVPKAA